MRPQRFRLKLLLAALLPLVLLAALLSYLWLTWSQRSLEDAMRQRLDAVSGQLAVAAEFHLFNGDNAALSALASEALGRDPDLVSVSIANANGVVLARSLRSGALGHDELTPYWPDRDSAEHSRLAKQIQSRPVYVDDPFLQTAPEAALGKHGSNLGQVSLVVSLKNLQMQRNRQLSFGFAAILLALGAAGLLAFVLADGIIRPVARIMAVVERIGQGDKSARLEPDTGSVLFQLEAGINRMADKVAMTQEDMQLRIDAATEELLSQKELAEWQARIDPLTGLHNRRAFVERAQLEMQRAHRYDSSLCLILLDLDYFKRINDLHGHATGDQVLIEVASALQQSLRDVDFVARLGGEEFVVLMPDTDLAAARLAAERMRQIIAAMSVEHAEGIVQCTVSIGISAFIAGAPDIGALMVEADQALYAAKAAGRDRVCVFGACGGIGRVQ
jgi:diguanylate cyclase (GGDEF)-like protein